MIYKYLYTMDDNYSSWNTTWNNTTNASSLAQREDFYHHEDLANALSTRIVPVVLHFLNISVIMAKKKLHKPGYWFLLNLSLSDALLMLSSLYRSCDNGMNSFFIYVIMNTTNRTIQNE